MVCACSVAKYILLKRKHVTSEDTWYWRICYCWWRILHIVNLVEFDRVLAATCSNCTCAFSSPIIFLISAGLPSFQQLSETLVVELTTLC